MKELSPIAKIAKETKRIMKHYLRHMSLKNPKPKDIRDFDDLMVNKKIKSK